MVFYLDQFHGLSNMKLSFIKNKGIQKDSNSDKYWFPKLKDGIPKEIPYTNNTVSFDIFDTILGRRVENIFDVVENEFPYPNFKKIRESCFGTIDDIYSQMQNYIEPEICKKLLEFEIQKEIENTYLIINNYNKVKNGDILVSDMYYTEAILRKILESAGFDKKVTIYVTPNGKYLGTIWNIVLQNHIIEYHLGDNIHSDVNMPAKYGIKTYHSNIHEYTSIERFFSSYGYLNFAFLLKEFRHKNPYPSSSIEFKLYNDQASYNIPILILISAILNDYMSKENRTTLLCQSRDGCLLEHIFPAIYPNYTCKRLETSRHMNRNATSEYKEYLKSMYDHSSCILFDLDGSMRSGRHLYQELFGVYPRVYIFQYYTHEDAPIYEGLSYTVKDVYASLNSFNADVVGPLIDYKDGKVIRSSLNYSFEHANIFKQTVISFCEFIKPFINKIPNDPKLLDIVILIHGTLNSNIDKNMED